MRRLWQISYVEVLTMSKEAVLVLAGLARLSKEDRREVLEEIDRMREQPKQYRRATRESWEQRGRVILGPVSISCPCCGR